MPQAATPPPLTLDHFPPLMTPYEVAEFFRVGPRCLVRWDEKGLVQTVRTLGGHRRYVRDSLLPYLEPAAS